MTSKIFTTPIPYIALILAHLIWGANFVVAKITLQEFPPFSLAFLRFALATIFIAPFFFTHTKKIKVEKDDLLRLIGVGLLMVTFNITFFFAGIVRTTAVSGAMLTLIIPMLSVLWGWWFLKEKVYLINLGGIFLGLLGALIVVGLPELLTGDFSFGAFTGNILIILACIAWVSGAVLSRKLLKKYPSLVVTTIAFAVGMITFTPSFILEYLQNPSWPDQITMLGLLGLIYMTILSSISAYFLFEWGLSRTSVAAADLFQYIEPFLAAVLAVAILNEEIPPIFAFGALLIILGVYLGTFAKERHHRYHKAHRT